MSYLLQPLIYLVVVVHLGYVFFVGFAGIAALSRSWLAWFHFPALLWSASLEIMHWNCPLTMLEKVLLARSGQPVYTTEFVEEYLKTLFFLSGDAVHYAHLAMTIWLIAANTVVYIWFVRRRLLPRT